MIQKLRRQFILVAMCSTLAVLVVIIGTLNILNYTGTVKKKDEILICGNYGNTLSRKIFSRFIYDNKFVE